MCGCDVEKRWMLRLLSDGKTPPETTVRRNHGAWVLKVLNKLNVSRRSIISGRILATPVMQAYNQIQNLLLINWAWKRRLTPRTVNFGRISVESPWSHSPVFRRPRISFCKRECRFQNLAVTSCEGASKPSSTRVSRWGNVIESNSFVTGRVTRSKISRFDKLSSNLRMLVKEARSNIVSKGCRSLNLTWWVSAMWINKDMEWLAFFEAEPS